MVLLTGATVWAGGSGLNVIVVVNQNSTNSLELGNDYCEARGVPPQNVLRMTNWTGGSIQWSPAQFTNYLLNPLLTMIAARGLTHQAQFVVLSMDIPYRVTDGNDVNSTTSTLYYGFKTNTAAPPELGATCSLPDGTTNSYVYAELPFAQSPPNVAPTNSFLAVMLTDTNLATAENTLRRGVASDCTYPTQTVYLEKTGDTVRNVRFYEFDNSVFENQVVGNEAVTRINSGTTVFTNLFGLQTGFAGVTLATNEFIPGSVGDSLTSFGGYILENSGQTPLLAFLEAGAAASYGTVVEPCNYPQKFPDPVDYFYQTRGFTVAEAYYQSLINPFEGLVVGEPLAVPFARPGGGAWSSLTNAAGLSGSVVLSPVFTAAATNLPLAQADLFVDGTYYRTMTNLPPAPGNVVSATVNGDTISYTVQANDTPATVAAGLATALNLQTNTTQVQAYSVGDRIELQSLALATPGSNVTVSAGSTVGTGGALTTHLTAARPVFLDTVATGYQVVTIYNAPQVGDWLQMDFIKTNGVMVSLAVTNTTADETIGTLAQSLVNLINGDATLQGADGLVSEDFFDADPYGQAAVQFNLYARTPGWRAAQILSTLYVSADLMATPVSTAPLADNYSDLRPKDHLYVSAGTGVLPVRFPLNTTTLANGWHQLTAVAYEGTSVGTQTRVVRNVQVQNTSLTATLSALPAGNEVTPGQTLQFTVTASATTIASINLYSTGGSLGVITNAATAVFTVGATNLGTGLHPFYALVTDLTGHQYQTQTLSYRVVPQIITVTLAGVPPALAWPVLTGSQYDVQFTTNLTGIFQTVMTITATNTVMQWPITPTGKAGFYRVRLDY
jgi:uncharacterized protein (TIGR03790 family)